MEKRFFYTLTLALGVQLLGVSVSEAILYVPGDFQIANGGSADWDAPTSPAMTDLTGGFHELALTGLTGAVALDRFQFKVLDGGETGAGAWGQDEVPDNGGGSPNNWFATDSNGDATITVDRNTYSDGFLPATDRITVSTDSLFSAYYATGSWEDEAGGTLGDFSGNDPLFQMTDQGGGLWAVDATIATPGSYEFKATAAGGAGAFDFQWGTNGRLTDSANYQFNSVAVDQVFTFMLDVSKGAIGFSTQTFVDGDTNDDTFVTLEEDFYPIRDNWLKETFLRAEGNLDNTGESEGRVDIADFRQWKNAWPGPPEAIAAAFASLGAVPEPSSAMLAVLAAVLLAGRRRRV